MPDAGDFEHDRDVPAADFGWGEAFAALPQEAPDAGGWQRLQTRLPPAARPRARWPLWLATAASLAAAIAVPLTLLPPSQGDVTTPQLPATSAAVAAHSGPARPEPAALRPEATPASPLAAIESDDAAPTPVARRDDARRAARTPPSQRPIRTAAQPPGATRLANVDAAPANPLEPLYARSAQLEDLLALARDERVASGTSAALTDALDARIATIDGALAQSGLSDSQREGLWRQRVDALQQLAGIETTQRLYSARGESFDAALVSID